MLAKASGRELQSLVPVYVIKRAMDTEQSLDGIYASAEKSMNGEDDGAIEKIEDDVAKQMLEEANAAIVKLKVHVNQAESFVEGSEA